MSDWCRLLYTGITATLLFVFRPFVAQVLEDSLPEYHHPIVSIYSSIYFVLILILLPRCLFRDDFTLNYKLPVVHFNTAFFLCSEDVPDVTERC
ncbi:hypothetical protein E2C01_077685 [Portunus trituberculatus]|uniref:Uncharacterized protein n=1 Tax=Portunus trituberculatus TaxID=210409 RepID=A0A5B7IMY9_PORTR|nr:hypothetical protein [Portunus trituberculatus]